MTEVLVIVGAYALVLGLIMGWMLLIAWYTERCK
jgi:hypothetical protein